MSHDTGMAARPGCCCTPAGTSGAIGVTPTPGVPPPAAWLLASEGDGLALRLPGAEAPPNPENPGSGEAPREGWWEAPPLSAPAGEGHGCASPWPLPPPACCCFAPPPAPARCAAPQEPPCPAHHRLRRDLFRDQNPLVGHARAASADDDPDRPPTPPAPPQPPAPLPLAEASSRSEPQSLPPSPVREALALRQRPPVRSASARPGLSV